jgi:hypothetical protein
MADARLPLRRDAPCLAGTGMTGPLLLISIARSARADHLPAAEEALLPKAVWLDRRAPSLGKVRLVDVVSDPNALIGSAQPVGLCRLTDEEKQGR